MHYFDDCTVGKEFTLGQRGPVTTEMMARWAAGSGDFNPIHYDRTEALRQGLPDVIIAGPMKFAMLLDCLTDWAGSQTAIRKAKTRYQGMDVAGTVFTFQATVTATDPDGQTGAVNLDIRAVNQHGETTTVGEATLVLPRRS
ncbi:MAG: hypothetical protein EXR52_03600 [Dehalococcoidia bacterium]|nr:hypothetical protein [Dehalococcoidia bacterium]